MRKTVTAALFSLGASLIAPTSMAAHHFHHGTSCEIASGSNANWIRDPAWGWVNNSSTNLPLICPIVSSSAIGQVRTELYNRHANGVTCWLTMVDSAGFILFQDDRSLTTASAAVQHLSWSTPLEEYATLTCTLPPPGALGPAALVNYFTNE